MSEKGIQTITIEWEYTPSDYFEAPFSVARDGYTLNIHDGKAIAQVDPGLHPQLNQLIEDIRDELKLMFMGAQVVSHRPFALSEPHPDIRTTEGRHIITIRAHPSNISVTSDNVDLVVTDSEGKIISDSRQERIDKKRTWAELAVKYVKTNVVAASLIGSHQAAVLDPTNELVHLYEIRDVLKKAFGKKVQQRLQLSNSQWSKTWIRLGELANTAPLKQGRHRGENPGALRDATPDELQEAREIAKDLIFRYLMTLENSPGGETS